MRSRRGSQRYTHAAPPPRTHTSGSGSTWSRAQSISQAYTLRQVYTRVPRGALRYRTVGMCPCPHSTDTHRHLGVTRQADIVYARANTGKLTSQHTVCTNRCPSAWDTELLCVHPGWSSPVLGNTHTRTGRPPNEGPTGSRNAHLLNTHTTHTHTHMCHCTDTAVNGQSLQFTNTPTPTHEDPQIFVCISIVCGSVCAVSESV